ncbi:MAG: hypothetical protein ACYCZR_03090 [Burkholderiales bacterium]
MAELVTQAEYARHRGVSPMAVSKAVKAKRILLIDGKIDPEVADIQWEKNTHPEQAARANAGKGPQLAANESSEYWLIKIRREKAEALKIELQLAEMCGKLVERAKVEAASYQVGRLLRDMVLAVPGKLAAELAAISDPMQIEIRMRDELRKVLSEISRLTRTPEDGNVRGF